MEAALPGTRRERPGGAPDPRGTPKLTDQQTNQLLRWIIGRDPRQFQFDFALWTRKIVGDLIRRKFDVELTPQGIGKLLHRIGLSPQRPLYRAYQQDLEAVRRWREEEHGRFKIVDLETTVAHQCPLALPASSCPPPRDGHRRRDRGALASGGAPRRTVTAAARSAAAKSHRNERQRVHDTHRQTCCSRGTRGATSSRAPAHTRCATRFRRARQGA